MKKQKVYLAGPLGFSEAGRAFHNTVIVPLLKELGFEVLDPWTLTSPALIDSAMRLPYGDAKRQRWQEINLIIGANNAKAIKRSDLMVAVLDGADVESGTASEIGYGAALGKFIIGYRGDFRLSAENEGGTVCLQVEYFIHLHGGKIVKSIDELKKALMHFVDLS